LIWLRGLIGRAGSNLFLDGSNLRLGLGDGDAAVFIESTAKCGAGAACGY
jgi:hypothetical protein|tara:strand:- start:453 stop:602 length:150 start_codon:yes stop_codon:yes gene_type:complete